MGLTPSALDAVDRLRNHDRRIRQLEIRRVGDPGALIYLGPYLAADWFTPDEGDPGAAYFYTDRGRVYFDGALNNTLVAPSTSVAVTGLPTAYRPSGGSSDVRKVMVGVDGENNDGGLSPDPAGKFWIASVLGTGEIAFNTHPDFMASPDFGYPPPGVMFALNFSYRITTP